MHRRAHTHAFTYTNVLICMHTCTCMISRACTTSWAHIPSYYGNNPNLGLPTTCHTFRVDREEKARRREMWVCGTQLLSWFYSMFARPFVDAFVSPYISLTHDVSLWDKLSLRVFVSLYYQFESAHKHTHIYMPEYMHINSSVHMHASTQRKVYLSFLANELQASKAISFCLAPIDVGAFRASTCMCARVVYLCVCKCKIISSSTNYVSCLCT